MATTTAEPSAAGGTTARSISMISYPLREKTLHIAARAGSGHVLGRKASPATIASECFKYILEELGQQQVSTSRMVEGHFHWLFPSTYKSEEALEQFMRAFACPMVVTDEELSLFLDFEVSTERSPPTAQNQHHFYFRSFKLTPAQLSKLIRYMNANDDNFPEMQAWRDVLDLHANEKNLQAPEFLTIRYIGTVQGPGRPIDRYLEDITSRTSGLLSHFQQCLESLYPDVAAAATANWIKSASLEF